jgi:hypothetical protein
MQSVQNRLLFQHLSVIYARLFIIDHGALHEF